MGLLALVIIMFLLVGLWHWINGDFKKWDEERQQLEFEREEREYIQSLPPAGWYADYDNPNALRYWDGRHWTGWLTASH